MELHELGDEPALRHDVLVAKAKVVERPGDELVAETLTPPARVDLGVGEHGAIADLVEVGDPDDVPVDDELVPARLLVAPHIRHQALLRPPSVYQIVEAANHAPWTIARTPTPAVAQLMMRT